LSTGSLQCGVFRKLPVAASSAAACSVALEPSIAAHTEFGGETSRGVRRVGREILMGYPDSLPLCHSLSACRSVQSLCTIATLQRLNQIAALLAIRCLRSAALDAPGMQCSCANALLDCLMSPLCTVTAILFPPLACCVHIRLHVTEAMC